MGGDVDISYHLGRDEDDGEGDLGNRTLLPACFSLQGKGGR